MKLMKTAVMIGLACAAMQTGAQANAQAVDASMINRISDEGYNQGQVVELAAHLTDRIGSRLTNSPGMREAEKWTQQMFTSWGLKNVRADPFEFGRGWQIESARVRMVSPRSLPLTTIPVAWTPGTKGAVTAPVIVAPIRHPRDLAQWKGKLKGMIVLVTYPEPPRDEKMAGFQRLDDAELGKLASFQQPSFNPENQGDRITRRANTIAIARFMADEGALAIVKMSYRSHGLVHGEGYFYKPGETKALPEIEMAQEDYRRLVRLAKGGEVTLEIDNRVKFDDRDTKAYNILADIPGRDEKAGYVMAGAHMDSWVAGDGATDNGAGVAVVMEAARILASLPVKPKRTIRFALWSGEEQGLLGSAAYVQKYLASRPRPADPLVAAQSFANWDTYPITPLPGFKDMAAYFNLDNGSGKIRGIYAENNFAAIPVLRSWMSPFDSMGASKVVVQKTGGTDHVIMAELGLPAFQFIQDPLDYESRAHHSNLDTFDHLRTEDLRQAAVIMATVLLQAAESEAPIPRNVLPRQPRPTDPFRYRDPARD